jgi:hypothetical protein
MNLVEFYSVVVCLSLSLSFLFFRELVFVVPGSSIATHGPLNRHVTANKAPPISLALARDLESSIPSGSTLLLPPDPNSHPKICYLFYF